MDFEMRQSYIWEGLLTTPSFPIFNLNFNDGGIYSQLDGFEMTYIWEGLLTMPSFPRFNFNFNDGGIYSQ